VAVVASPLSCSGCHWKETSSCTSWSGIDIWKNLWQQHWHYALPHHALNIWNNQSEAEMADCWCKGQSTWVAVATLQKIKTINMQWHWHANEFDLCEWKTIKLLAVKNRVAVCSNAVRVDCGIGRGSPAVAQCGQQPINLCWLMELKSEMLPCHKFDLHAAAAVTSNIGMPELYWHWATDLSGCHEL